jgi:hypothetical protein
MLYGSCSASRAAITYRLSLIMEPCYRSSLTVREFRVRLIIGDGQYQSRPSLTGGKRDPIQARELRPDVHFLPK